MPVIIDQLDLIDTRPTTNDEPAGRPTDRPAGAVGQAALDAVRVAEQRRARIHAD